MGQLIPRFWKIPLHKCMPKEKELMFLPAFLIDHLNMAEGDGIGLFFPPMCNLSNKNDVFITYQALTFNYYVLIMSLCTPTHFNQSVILRALFSPVSPALFVTFNFSKKAPKCVLCKVYCYTTQKGYSETSKFYDIVVKLCRKVR